MTQSKVWPYSADGLNRDCLVVTIRLNAFCILTSNGVDSQRDAAIVKKSIFVNLYYSVSTEILNEFP